MKNKRLEINTMYGYIYKTTNVLNGMIYIGKCKKDTFNPAYLGSGKYLKRAINKYGIENFVVELIEFSYNKSTQLELERFYIKFFREFYGRGKLYNLADGGNGGDTGVVYTEKYKKNHSKVMKKFYAEHPEIKEKQTEDMVKTRKGRGYYHSQNGLRNLREVNRGKIISQESIQKGIRTFRKNAKKRGYFFSEERNKKVSKSHQGEKSYMAKLTEMAVKVIFHSFHDGYYSFKEIAEAFEISIHTVYDIAKKKTWKHLWD